MAVEEWLVQSAAELWSRTGEAPALARNRDPELLAMLALRATPQPMAGLTLSAASEWLRQRGYAPPAAAERNLYGYLFTERGDSFIFYETRVCEREQRYTIAHEAAHLWIETVRPRERAVAELGPAIREVMDGVRSPTAGERGYCLLHRLSLTPIIHLLERDPEHGLVDGTIYAAEERADRLALELLAPEAEAVTHLPDTLPWRVWVPAATKCLADEFELPVGIAESYARRLAPRVGAAPSFLERLSGAG